jgi:rsbT antagonist protein RsbS
MSRVPVIHLGETLIATVQEDLHDRDALDLQTDLSETLEHTNARGVLLDISSVEMIDSFLGRVLSEIATICRLLGAYTVVVGMRPAVAITLVELGLELRGIRTALNSQKGLALLARLLGQERNGDGRRDR